jgi:hypothetical protein
MSEIKNRKSISDKLSKYLYTTNNDIIEITEWINGEGFDVSIADKPVISLQYNELDAINYLLKKLEYDDK